MKNIAKGTIIRTAVLVLALVNTSLQLFGFDVLPFGEQEIEMAVTAVLNAGAAMAVWWRNNSFTDAGRKADAVLEEEKAKRRSQKKLNKK